MGADQGPEPVAATPQPSRIVIEFDGPGLANHQVRLDHVDPAQVYAAAFLLDCVARELRSGSLIKEAIGPGGLGPGLDLSTILGGLRG